jgi:hypothetical protein
LSLYLWNINFSVALPVVVVTGLATLVYTCATILPLVDRFCPYTTPASRILRAVVISVADSFYRIEHTPIWVGRVLEKIFDLLKPISDQSTNTSSAADDQVPMDSVTSQMLSWLIVNCEDPRSIDTALQAIAGASHKLPQEPLVESGAGQMLLQRLMSCSQMDPTSGRYRLRDPALSPLVTKHLRAYILLVSGNTHYVHAHRWQARRYDDSELWLAYPESLIPDICSM